MMQKVENQTLLLIPLEVPLGQMLLGIPLISMMTKSKITVLWIVLYSRNIAFLYE